MRKGVRGKLEMAARVRQFCRAHPSEDPGYATVLGRFENHLARAEAIVARQHNGLTSARGARARRGELRRVVHFQLLRYLISVGAIAARTRTELAEKFRLPDTRITNRGFLTAVRAMLTLAEAHKDALVAEGMSPGLLEELGAKVTEFETVSDAARTARLDHIGPGPTWTGWRLPWSRRYGCWTGSTAGGSGGLPSCWWNGTRRSTCRGWACERSRRW